MSIHNPKTGPVFKFVVRHGRQRSRTVVIWAPSQQAAEDAAREWWPTSEIKLITEELSRRLMARDRAISNAKIAKIRSKT